MDLAKEFGTDSEKEMEGVWCRISDDAEALIARANNRNFRDFNKNALKPFMRRGRLSISDEKMEDVTRENIAKTVFLKIRGKWQETDDDGQLVDVKDNPANRVRILKTYPELMETVLTYANDFELYREEQIADTVGN